MCCFFDLIWKCPFKSLISPLFWFWITGNYAYRCTSSFCIPPLTPPPSPQLLSQEYSPNEPSYRSTNHATRTWGDTGSRSFLVCCATNHVTRTWGDTGSQRFLVCWATFFRFWGCGNAQFCCCFTGACCKFYRSTSCIIIIVIATMHPHHHHHGTATTMHPPPPPMLPTILICQYSFLVVNTDVFMELLKMHLQNWHNRIIIG